LTKQTIELEKQVIDQNQYDRNRQIELWNLPPELIKDKSQEALKREAATLLSLTQPTDAPVLPSQIDVVHKLKKEGNIIVELTSRTLQAKVLKGRKTLKEKTKQDTLKAKKCGKLSVVESLCQEYKKLDYACRMISKKNQDTRSFFFNRKLFLVRSVEGQDKFHRISHISDLYALYGDTLVDGLFKKDGE